MLVLGLDPGPEYSAVVGWDGTRVLEHQHWPNAAMLDACRAWRVHAGWQLVIERIASYGMPVGEEVFATVFWSGRFAEAWGRDFHRLYRRDVKLHLCADSRARDPNVRRALLDRYPAGTKKAPGPSYGLAGDEWAAFAVAVTWYDLHRREFTNS